MTTEEEIGQLRHQIAQQGKLLIDLHNRLKAIEESPQCSTYKPTEEEVITMMENTGEIWEVCEQKLVEEFHVKNSG